MTLEDQDSAGAEPACRPALSQEWMREAESFLAFRRRPFIVLDDTIWWKVGPVLTPFAPLRPALSPKTRDLRKALIKMKAPVASYTTGFSDGAQGRFHAIVRSRPLVMEEIPGKSRRFFRRGMERFDVRRMTSDEYARLGYDAYVRAAQRYERYTLDSREEFDRTAEAFARHPSIVEIWGAFDGPVLAGYVVNYVFGSTEVAFSTGKFDPAYFRAYLSYAVFHVMINHYLTERGISYVNAGLMSVIHPTRVQEFLVHEIGFSRQPLRNIVCFPAPVSRIAVPAAAALQRVRPSSLAIEGFRRLLESSELR